MNAVNRFANHAAGLCFDDLPEMALTRGRQIIMDTLGTALGGYQTPLGGLTVEFTQQEDPGDQATMIGDGRRSTVEGAAWANAVMAKHLGMDDSHRTGGHVAAQLVPLVLALGEFHRLDGRTALTALAAGYDVVGTLQPAVEAPQRARGLDHKGQVGTLASAVTAAVAMGLDEDQIANALAIAMDMACGTEQYVYDGGKCDTKDLLSGYAARNGIKAAKMAKFGFRGPPGALDGPYGYFHAFGDGFDPAILDHLGSRSELGETGFKPHAGCRYVHACVDAVQGLLKTGAPPLEKIAKIRVGTYRAAMTPSFRVDPQPESMAKASFSLVAAVSVALVRGSWYADDIRAFDQPEIRRLRPLVEVYLDEQLEAIYPAKNGCVVEVTTTDGQEYVGRVDYAKGEPENMLTDAEFEAKFRRLNGDLLPPKRVDQIMATVARLEELTDVGELMRLTATATIGDL